MKNGLSSGGGRRYNEPMSTKTELYSPSDPERLKKKHDASLATVYAIAAVAVALCVVFCLRTGTANAMRMELLSVAVFTLAGWVDIYLLTFSVAVLKREREHAARMLAPEREKVCGAVELGRETVRIPRSIAVRAITVTGEGRPRRLYVNAARCAALEQALGGDMRVCELDVVGGYVAAFEVCHEDP